MGKEKKCLVINSRELRRKIKSLLKQRLKIKKQQNTFNLIIYYSNCTQCSKNLLNTIINRYNLILTDIN
jgi:hypothetical protein